MSEEPKIIIDEDWKSQVKAERESLKEETAKSKPEDAEDADPNMPPASFEMLLTTLATEAMVALGQLPNPATSKLVHRPNQAKYLIDTIEVLKEKTSGNLSPAETEALDGLLHQLKMAFVTGPPTAVES